MQYRRFTTGPWPELSLIQKLFVNVFLFWIPKGNPDFEETYTKVHYFWLEIDDQGDVTREVGFNSDDEPITAAPLESNYGIFTDLDGAPSPLESSVDQVDFERAFSAVADRLMSKAKMKN
ncbi:MAG: hypothetical protein JNM12_03310 [Alphaproteobacteria bacterium]|nr:hypothetical protein [Alphaproteobacteria bacterium]